MNKFKRFAMLLSLIIVSAGSFARAQVLPSKEWKSLSVGSFELIYDAGNQALAELYAQRLRHLTEPMAQDWVHFPRRTIFVLNDRTDLTNGYATFLPYSLIMIYPVLPGPMESIGEFNDWAWEISVHEYTHILEFEQRRGLVWGLSYVFGSIMTPNTLLPRWWLEGAAVEAETRYSRAGRLRSKMQAGILRSLVVGAHWPELKLPEINEVNIPTWPYGSRPYLYGSYLWSDWVAEKGPAAVRDPHYAMGGRVPYMLAGALEPTFDGKDQVALFSETKSNLTTRATQELTTLQGVPVTEGALVDPDMVESLSPAVSPDGLKLAYIGKNETLRRRIQVLIRPRTELPFDPSHRIQWFGREYELGTPGGSPLPRGHDGDDGPPGGNINRISWHPSSRSFVFDQLAEKNRFQEISDLWSFDLQLGKATRLTRDARAREPSYSPDGRQIAFVQLDAGRTHLAVYNADSGEIRRVFEAPLQARVSFPSWLNNEVLLFSLRENGSEKVQRLDLSSGERSQILAEWADPQFLSIEKNRILFTSTQNGVRNLYSSSLALNEVVPVTHSISHVMTSSYDESTRKFYYTEITAQGLQLKSLDTDATTRLPPNLPKLTSFWETRYANSPGVPVTFNGKDSLLTAESRDYSPWGYLWPRYWIPLVTWDDLGTYLTISTSGSDPLQKHLYSITASYDSAIQRASYVLGYSNQVFWPRLSFTAYDYSQQLATTQSFSRTQLVQGLASWEIASISPDLFVGVGANTSTRERFGRESRRSGPVVAGNYQQAFQSGNQISPENGWLASWQFSAPRDERWNRTFYTTEASATVFLSRWLPERHALMLKAQGRYTDEVLQVETMEQSLSLKTLSNSPFPEYLNRGYPAGTFLGRNILSNTLEYRFPIRRFDTGGNYVPYFLYRVHGALIADGIFVDGYAYDFKDLSGYYRVEGEKAFWSAGAEARFDMSLGFHIPLTTAIGLYWPMDGRFVQSGPRLGLSILL